MTPRAEKIVAGSRLALFVGMLALLSAPVLAWLLRVPELTGVIEMRSLAGWPQRPATELGRWPAAFEAWLNDHFPSRIRIVQWHGLLWRRWLGEPSSKVVVGRDDWLFYSGDRTMEDWGGARPV